MSQEVLNLLFPQWQGSGNTKELYFGAKEIEEHFRGKIEFTEVDVNTTDENETQNCIYSYSSIIEHLIKANKIIKSTSPKKILTVGGDCGVELAPVSFLNSHYSDDLAVIWFDAHGDLNIPEESLSHHFHGMPLRSLLGEGDKNIIQSCFSNISANQVFLVGGRDYDQAEKVYINKNKINRFSVAQITSDHENLIKKIRSKGFDKLYVHIDLDVLDPKCFPHVKCPTKSGLSLETLKRTVSSLKESFSIFGISVVEYSPTKESGTDYIEEIIQASGFI